MHIDTFSGPAAELPRGRRTPEEVLAALKKNPRVSTFDMGESRWLRGCIDELKSQGLIVEQDEPYPWHRFEVRDAEARG